MRRLAVVLLLIGAALIAASSGAWAATQAPAGYRKLALIIGNSAYPETPLRNPANDARAMADKLRGLGFEVIELENASQARMNEAITEFSERLTDEGAALVYYAGHGLQVQGRNFLVPVDARVSTEVSVRNTTVDLNQILDSIGDANRRTNIIILDACRNNPFGRFRALSGGLAQISAPAGTLIAYATAPGMTASDGAGANGTYTGEILRALDLPGLRVEDVFKRVRVNVAKITGGAQIPWESSSLVGDFYFRPPVVTSGDMVAESSAPAPMVADAATAEIIFWQGIAESQDAAGFEAYLRKYPDGSFAELARLRLNQLSTAASSPEAPLPAPKAANAGQLAATPTVAAALSPASKGPDATAEPEASAGSYFTTQRIGLRERPAGSARIVRRIEAGAPVDVRSRSRDGEWLQIEAEGKTGWVGASLIETGDAKARVARGEAQFLPGSPRRGRGGSE
jgi:uncharacterized caspase-like protein